MFKGRRKLNPANFLNHAKYKFVLRYNPRIMRKKTKLLMCQIFASLFILVFLCEYFIYYIVLLQCSWPRLSEKYLEPASPAGSNEKKEPVKAMFMADLHLVSRKGGRWFEGLRREWQMHKSFQTAISLFDPEVIFVLGDLFDQATRSDDVEFYYFLKRLIALFTVKDFKRIYFIAGNHDMGFHYDISKHNFERFSKTLRTPPVQMVSIRGNHFVLVNSMALEGDGCFLCRSAQVELNQIARKLRCAKGIGKCFPSHTLSQYSRPVVLQHFPMYRESDKNCADVNFPSYDDEEVFDFLEGWNCVSKESSEMIYDLLNPRLIVGGHTHHECHLVHRKDIHEYTIPSFNSWFRNNPSFLMGVFVPSNYSLSKCYVPQASVITFIYCMGLGIILIFIIVSLYPIPYELAWKRVRW